MKWDVRIVRFIDEKFALVVVGGIVGLFGLVALIGPKPGPRPPPPPVVVTLPPADRHRLAQEIASAIVAARDAGAEAQARESMSPR